MPCGHFSKGMGRGDSRNGTCVYIETRAQFRLMSFSGPLSMIPSLLQHGPIDKDGLALMGEVGSN